jgi:diguanylate cyclase (GGDEF)-like protein/PAS domain S-box-containing protein
MRRYEKMKKTLSLLIYYILLNVSVAFATSEQTTANLEKVTLQLKWMHQFQFAGYYAAKEQGYYAAEGLDVDIFERLPEKDVVQQVVSGERNFAVGDSGILSYYARGEPIVALAAIFQHNPLVFVSKQNSGIISPYEMKGKRIMFDVVGAGDSTLRAMLTDAGLTEKDYTVVKQNFKDEDFINNRIDVMSAYLSNEIFNFQQKNIKINIINPQNYSIDFYGDMLFTSQSELLTHPERAEKFRRATLKGWQYALDHSEELIQLIHKKYLSKHSLEHLRFEAEATRKLILPDLIPLGQIDTGRLRKVAEVYAQLNLSDPLSENKLAQFIAQSSHSADKPLIVGSEQDFPPLALGKTDATADGFTVELWREVAKEAHLNSNIRVLPWNQVEAGFKAEKIDVLINLAISNERRQFADFSIPHVVLNGAIFVRNNDKFIHTETDLNTKQIIVVNSDLAPEYLQEKGWDKQLISVDTAEEGLKLLASGQYDAMLLSKLIGKLTLEKCNINNIKMLPIDIGLTQKFSFAVHKGDAELLAKINEALAIIKANGTYDKLHEKWFGIYEEKELLPLVIKYLAPIVIVFLFILVVIFYRRHVERKQSEKQLTQSEHRLRAMFEASPECVKLVARDGTILSMSQKGIVWVEADSVEAVCNRCVYPIIAPEYRAAFQAFNESVCDGKSGSLEFEIIGLKGTRHWMLTHAVPFHLENGDCVQLAFTQEISERKAAETELRIAAIAFEAQEGITVTDENNRIIRVNKAFTEITGYTVEEIIGKTPKLLQSGRHDAAFYNDLWESVNNTGMWAGEIWNRRKDAEIYPQYMAITAVKNLDGKVTNYVSTFNDITLSRANADEIERLAFYDPLTNLPNRRLLQDRLKQALAASHRNHTSGGLLFIDMDNFKNLNDTLGHEMGDFLLVQVAERLLSCVRESDTVARLGGDEFVVLLEDLEYKMPEAAAQVEIIGKKILLTLRRIYQLNSHQYISTPSIGAVLFNDHEQTPEELLKQADIAMYQVKAAGRNDLRFFNPQMQATIMAREALKKELHLAIEENQFRLYYQAQVYHNRQITGAEALIRWQHPERGLISPDTFIPLAEESDLILLIGNWVLETACVQLKLWESSKNTQHLQLAVNVSARQFSQSNFVSDVIRLINDKGINPTRLKLELTESMALDNLKETIDKMNTLREIGVRFSMDDFGTGHSSLSSLKKLPIEQLKIDQSFVRDISTDSDDAVIVQTIIAMAQNLGLKIIAEGVETEEQCLFLEQHGCQNFQGYLFSKGVPIKQFEALI